MNHLTEENTYAVYDKQTKKLDTISTITGEVINESTDIAQYLYTIAMGDMICNLLREGKTLLAISEMESMPALHTLYNWRASNPEFKKKTIQAKKERAEYYHDRAAALVEEAQHLTKDDVPANKLAIDSFIKLAEKGSPEEFAAKPQLLQTQVAPAMIVINTGINREPVTVEVQHEDSKQNQTITVGKASEETTVTCQIIEEDIEEKSSQGS